MPSFVTLDALTEAHDPLAGGKASGCGRLKRAGFPVPDGLVVLSSTTDADLTRLPSHPWFDAQPADAAFAVRSSGADEDGTADSFAGLYQTRLDVPRDAVIAAVRACRASGDSPEAREYRRARRLQEHQGVGVLVQRMIHPVAAGVGFTRNPLTDSEHEVVLNAAWGLADALVGGRLDPDEFVIRKSDGAIVWRRIGGKGDDGEPVRASLTDDQAVAIARVLVDVERFFQAPQDIEWCHDGTQTWIVQSRPITTRASAGAEIEWSRANLAEVLPDLTSPQALDAFEVLLNRAEDRYLGALKPEDVGPFVRAFLGRLYVNVSMLRRICILGGIPPAAMLRSMGHAGAIDPADEEMPPFTLRQLKLAPALLRMASRHLRVPQSLARHEATVARLLDQMAASDPWRLSDAELWHALHVWFDEAPGNMQLVLVLANVLFLELPLRAICDRVGQSFERLVYPQLAAGERSVSARQAFDLIDLVQLARRHAEARRCLTDPAAGVDTIRTVLAGTPFLHAFEAFLRTYGHRGRYESDWSLPRYREDPAPLIHALRLHLEDDSNRPFPATDEVSARAASAAWEAFDRRLSSWQRITLLPRARWLVRRIKQYYVWRERVRSDLARILEGVRRWHLELAGRFVARGWISDRDEYFLLKLDEVAGLATGKDDPAGLQLLLARRRAQQDYFGRIQAPLLMRESELPVLVRAAGLTGGPESETGLIGQPVSVGIVEADVVVLRDPSDFGEMRRGAILVAPATDPSWTPLFTLASGVIVEVGGVLSHASTIAREYGLPAVANVRHATRRLRTGDRVRLDAYAGRVERLDSTSR